jgi:hypothetical protein
LKEWEKNTYYKIEGNQGDETGSRDAEERGEGGDTLGRPVSILERRGASEKPRIDHPQKWGCPCPIWDAHCGTKVRDRRRRRGARKGRPTASIPRMREPKGVPEVLQMLGARGTPRQGPL